MKVAHVPEPTSGAESQPIDAVFDDGGGLPAGVDGAPRIMLLEQVDEQTY